MNDMELAVTVAERVKAAGGKTYFVGGFVRDRLLGIENKDIDIEIHDVSPDTLKEILDTLGERTEFGKSFGVYGVKGNHLDIAMPRRERLSGNAHTSFDIDIDPCMGELEASRRRDFTVNALMQDVLTGDVLDFWGGLYDLSQGIIRHVDDNRFSEDALRVLRAARFSAKLGFEIAPKTMRLCQSIDLTNLSRERVWGETQTALLKSNKPSVFFEQLRAMKQISDWFPELYMTINTMQNQIFHREGDVWTHTMMVLDEAAKLRDEAVYPLGLMTSALCHDFGKAMCTLQDDKGIYHSYSHEEEGIPLARRFLERMTTENYLKTYVLNMVSMHGEPHDKVNHQSRIKSTNKMFNNSIEPKDLILLCTADSMGKIPQVKTERHFLEERLAVYEEIMSRPFVQGRDLIAAGMMPDKHFSELLEHAHKLRLAGIDKESALKQVLATARKKKMDYER